MGWLLLYSSTCSFFFRGYLILLSSTTTTHYFFKFLNLVLSLEDKLWLATYQKVALHNAFSSSPQRWWTSTILSTDLQIPLHFQSNEATHILPARAFHSQSAHIYTRSMVTRGFSFIYCDENQNNIPGGVPQHILLSSTCSTSKPMNHDPNETSSFAYLCSTFLTL
jgi:hypothetical protein